MAQCENIVYVLNEQFEYPKLRVLEKLTDMNEYDTNDTQIHIV